MLKRTVFILIIIISLYSFLFSASFQTSGIGTRALGMGCAFTAVCDDVNAIYFNPSGLVNIKYPQISMMYYDMYSEGLIGSSFLGAAFPYTGPGTLAIGWYRIGVNDDMILNGFSENIISTAYGFHLFKCLSMGFSLKFLGAFYDRIKGLGYSADASLYYKYEDLFFIGLLYQDFTKPVIQWETDLDEDLDSNLRTGIAVRPFTILLISADMDQITLERKAYHFGFEMDPLPSKVFQIRGGVIHRSQEVLSYSMGASLKLRQFVFHYGLYNHSSLGFSHIFGLSFEF